MLVLVYFIVFMFGGVAQAFDLGAKLKTDLAAPKVRIVLGLDSAARLKYMESLKIELHSLQQQWGNFSEFINQKIVEIQKQIDELKSVSSVKSSTANIRKMNLLHKVQNLLHDINITKFKIIDLLQQHIDFLSQVITQPENIEGRFDEKSLYSCADFQNISKRLFVLEDQLHQILLKKDEILHEMGRQENLVATKEKDFSMLEHIIEEKKRHVEMKKDDISLLDLEKEMVVKERELASLLLSLYHKQQEFLISKESVIQEKIQTCNQDVEIVRDRLYIDLNDVAQYEKKNAEQKKSSELKKIDLAKLKQETLAKKIDIQEEYNRLKHRFKIAINSVQHFIELDQETQTISERFGLYSTGAAFNMTATLDRVLQKIKLEITLQDSFERQAQVALQTVKLLYDIVQKNGKDSETVEKERAEYKVLKNSLHLVIKQNKEAMVLLHTQLKENQAHLEHFKRHRDILQSTAQNYSSSMQKKWQDSLIMLTHNIQELEQQQEVMMQSSELYEQLLRCDEQTLESVSTILHEFDMIGVWHRSMSAVTIDGIKNIIPNLLLFLKNVYIILTTYVAQLTLQKIAYGVASFGFGGLLAFFLLLFGLFIAYLLLQALLPSVYRYLICDDYDDTDPLYRWRHLFAIIVGFGGDVFKPLYIWILCLLYEFLYDVPVALLICFYLYSIVFWIYASRRLLHLILGINRKFDYFLLSKRLIDRFSFVFSFFSIATIIILVMRKMFIVVMLHQQTELPNILLRVYHVVIFISIILSLDKDEISQILPKKSSVAKRFAQVFERHYYLFLLGIFSLLVMSDPYLGGYASLLWHVFWNLFLTIVVFAVSFLVYTVIKEYSMILFFELHDDDTKTDRFEHARLWYATFVVASMLVCAGIALLLCLQIWNYGFTYTILRKIALYELFKIESFNSAGKIISESFKVINLLYIIAVTISGFIAAGLFKRFVLQRLFDIQYVEPGIQNTISIISRYIIIIIAITLACIHAKLGYLVTYASYFGLVVFGWSFKDLFTDFVAYFFILVQRPVKLGDYVKIDDETMGVVRRVGPRAVILRRKNSVNIVVPNSTILKSPLYNWNYSRSYIGFDDIVFSVPFGTDIQLVRKICFEVLDEDQDVLKVPQPFVRLQDFGDKGYVFMIRGFLSSGNTLRQWDIASNIRFVLVEKLAKAGITIAGPSMRVLMKDTSDLR